MSKISTSPNPMDYTEEFTLFLELFERSVVAQETLAEQLTVIATAATAIATDITLIKDSQASIANSTASMKDTQAEILNRGSNEDLGIYINSEGETDGGLSRAMAVHALKSTGQLDAIAAEMTNPTPLP